MNCLPNRLKQIGSFAKEPVNPAIFLSNSNERRMSRNEFDELFQQVCNWGRWGKSDGRGTLNYISPATVKRASSLVRAGRSVSLSRCIDTVASEDNTNPAIHHMTQCYDTHVEGEDAEYSADYLGCACHGNAHSHFDALCHISWKGKLFNGLPASATVTSRGAKQMDIFEYRHGIIGRGVLLDIPRFRNKKWLEPGEAVTAEELKACEESEGVRMEEGDVFVFRVAHVRRRQELGPWNVDEVGRAGLGPSAMRLLHERKIAAFLPDADGEVVPSPVDGVKLPVHTLQIASMGLACGDSLQLEELSRMCEEEKRWEFMVVAAPLALPGGTGSLVNPIAIL